MLKKINCGMLGIVALLAVNGCATGRNYQADMDALNAKISALQGQVVSKEDELSRLRSEVSESESSQRAALAKAESENRVLNERLNEVLEKLEAGKSAKKAEKKREESDLK